MAGAGLADYEAAFHQIRCGQSSLIGPSTLQASPHLESRAGSEESEAGFALRDVRSLVHRLDGYLPVTCACGLTTKVPSGYGQDQVHCLRCGKMLSVPAARQIEETGQPSATKVMQYNRQSRGWESFRCQCGQTLQLSPSFGGTHLTCNQCGRRIEIEKASA
jgi:hypothetical protein